MQTHIDKRYEEGLQLLKEQILKMGGGVEEMILFSTKGLFERDSKKIQEVIQKDERVNEMEIAIDDRCLELLALHQPAAGDLRFITIGLKISKDLERMGDLAVNIAESAVEINKEPLLKPYADLPAMAGKVQKMVQDVLDAFVRRDPQGAKKICEMDDEIDDYKTRIFEELLQLMQKDSTTVSRGVHLIAVAKHLERIADHATNIAEEVIFMMQGKDIRHGRN